MTTIMIWHVRSKYTAVGRKEIITFFYLYMALTVISLILDSGVVPLASVIYPYFVAVQCGLATATCWCLLVNGFVGFQFAEDGTPLSLWVLRLTIASNIVTPSILTWSLFDFWRGVNLHLPRMGQFITDLDDCPLRRIIHLQRRLSRRVRHSANRTRLKYTRR